MKPPCIGTYVKSVDQTSTLLPDTDQSKNFLTIIKQIETMPEAELPDGQPRELILRALREFVDAGSELLRLEEEGTFQFWSADAFAELIAEAGFVSPRVQLSFGTPPQGVIVTCQR